MKLETFSERLTWLRTVGGVAGRWLFRLAGVAESYSSVVEKKPTLSPRAKTVSRIAKCFGVSEAWLMFGGVTVPNEATIKRAVARAQQRYRARQRTTERVA